MIATTRNGKVEVLIDNRLTALFDKRGRLLKIDGRADGLAPTSVITLARAAQNFARKSGFFEQGPARTLEEARVSRLRDLGLLTGASE